MREDQTEILDIRAVPPPPGGMLEISMTPQGNIVFTITDPGGGGAVLKVAASTGKHTAVVSPPEALQMIGHLAAMVGQHFRPQRPAPDPQKQPQIIH